MTFPPLCFGSIETDFVVVFLALRSVLDKVHREDRIHIKAKTVNFSWQRGNKIGQVRMYLKVPYGPI